MSNALLAMEGSPAAASYLDHLASLGKVSSDKKQVWWESDTHGRTLFHGGGQSGSVETTALATLALLQGNGKPENIRDALSWLAAQKDGRGTWHSTQATVLALKALLAGTDRPLGGDKPRRLAVKLDGEQVEEVEIPADQADVVSQLDFSQRVASGARRLTLEDRSATSSNYQVVVRYHVPELAEARESGPLGVRLDFDRTKVKVDKEVEVTASVTNAGPTSIPMVVVELPTAPGFSPVTEDVTIGSGRESSPDGNETRLSCWSICVTFTRRSH
jgi:hypothetical protein